MKQLLENLKNGDITVDDVPPPVVRPGFILVRNHYSLISTGTEGGTVKLGKMSMLGKAKARPEQAKKVISVARNKGLLTAYNATMRSLDMPIVLGYSCVGEIIDVGTGVTDFEVGDKVACAGSGFANHAEIVSIPRNLCVKVPSDVDMRYAAFTTLGTIALQGIRISKAGLGDNVVVIGLGLVGLLTAQILRAAGCNVFGLDVDCKQIEFVKKHKFCEVANIAEDNIAEQISAFTSGHGADSVIICATTANNGPVELAGKISRRKGRVVAVGRTEIKAPRDTFLFKELELLTSYAYGPGVDDPSYEENGVDYPIGYVRWTENRNMTAFIQLLKHNSLNLEPLITHNFIIDDAQAAFDTVLEDDDDHSIAVLLSYPKNDNKSNAHTIRLNPISKHTSDNKQAAIGISIIGAGSHATNDLIPTLQKIKNIDFRGISSATGVRAKALGNQYNFEYCTSYVNKIFEDKNTHCVYILTRHDTHASLTANALNAGKHVFVEKPLALSLNELDSVIKAYNSTNKGLMIGFNRRYAPMAIKLKEFFANRAQPLSIHFRSNVGYRPPNHWLHDPVQGGGVILGEACHFVDFCHWLTGTEAELVDIVSLSGKDTGLLSEDNVHITIKFAEGSVATITYLSNGSTTYSRERVEVHCDNKTAVLTDFKRLELSNSRNINRTRSWLSADMGHLAQAKSFVSSISENNISAIDTLSYIESSHSTILANDKLKISQP